MSRNYLTEKQYNAVLNLKMKGASFVFECLSNGKHMMVAVLGGREIRLVAIPNELLYPFKEELA